MNVLDNTAIRVYKEKRNKNIYILDVDYYYYHYYKVLYWVMIHHFIIASFIVLEKFLINFNKIQLQSKRGIKDELPMTLE